VAFFLSVVTSVTLNGCVHHIVVLVDKQLGSREKEKEAVMMRQDFLFMVSLAIALFLVQRESGHWKH
jgi:hypothetical protein